MVCALKQKHWHTLTSVPVAISGAHRGPTSREQYHLTRAYNYSFGSTSLPSRFAWSTHHAFWTPMAPDMATRQAWVGPRQKAATWLWSVSHHDTTETEGFLYNKAAGTLELEPFLVANLGFWINCPTVWLQTLWAEQVLNGQESIHKSRNSRLDGLTLPNNNWILWIFRNFGLTSTCTGYYIITLFYTFFPYFPSSNVIFPVRWLELSNKTMTLRPSMVWRSLGTLRQNLQLHEVDINPKCSDETVRCSFVAVA